MQKHVRQIDQDGNPIDGCLVYVAHRPRIKGGFFMAFQEALIALAVEDGLTKAQYRILHYLMGKLDFENYIYVPQLEISTALRIDRANVSRDVNALCKRGLLLKGPKVGKIITYRLSPSLGWKGNVRSLQDERKRRLALATSSSSTEPQP